MGVLIKFLLKNIGEKKFRTVLILISVMMSATLYMGTAGMSTTIVKMYKERIKQWVGSAELMVRPGKGASSNFFLPEITDPFADMMEYAVGSIQSSASLSLENTTINFNLYGFEYESLQQFNPFPLFEQLKLLPFTGRKAIIGSGTAERHGLVPGQSVKLDIGGTEHRFVIAGIAAPAGFFTDDGRSETMIVPLDTLAAFSNARGRVSSMYVKSLPEVGAETLKPVLERNLPRYFISETIGKRDLKTWTDNMTLPFKITLTLVLAISVFIIYSSFHVITTERLPVIGTFRSIGATRLMTDSVLFGESLLYGVLGGALGSGLGILAVYVMSKITMPQWLSQVDLVISFTPNQLAQSFFLAVGLALISSAIPIIRVSKLPIKEVILGTVRHRVKKGWRKRVVGVLLIAVGVTAPFFAPDKAALIINTACMLFAIAGMTQLIPDITNGFVYLLQRGYQRVFGNIGNLSAKNLRDNSSILNNIILLAIGISGLFLITTISHSVSISTLQHYRDSNYDLEFSTWNLQKEVELTIRTVPGVEDTYGIYDIRRVRIGDTEEQINIIHGVDPEKFPKYFSYRFQGSRDELLAKLDTGRFIIVTRTLQKQNGWEVGDTIPFRAGKNRQFEYTIIGFFDSLMWNGSYALVGERFLKMDSGKRTYSYICIKSSVPPLELKQRLQAKFKRRGVWMMTVDEMSARNMESNKQLFTVMKGFSYMAMLIGIIGIVNNFIIGFIERRRSLALFRSVGMSKGQTIAMVFIEALSGGLVGAIAGLVTGLIILAIVPQLLTAMAVPVSIFISRLAFIQFLVGGIIVTMIASISPAMKSSKLNIIEAIKYE